jgi:membrane-associated phospholipid phosphatase
MPTAVIYLLLTALACAGGVAVLGTLFYSWARFNHYDSTLTAHLLAEPDSATETAFQFAADLANLGPLALVLVGIALLGIVWGRPWHLLAAASVVLFANVTTQLLKAVLAHPRLQGALGADYPVEIAYPSGHTTAAFSAGVALWLITPPRWRGWAAMAGVAYGTVVAAGVVVAGWHFISDTVGAVMVVGFWTSLVLAALVQTRLEAPADWLPEGEGGAPEPLRGPAEGPARQKSTK